MWDLNSIERASDAELVDTGLDRMIQNIGRIVQDCGGAETADESERILLTQALTQLERMERLAGTSAAESVLLVKMMTLGKLGRFEEAIATSRSAYAAHPSWHTAVTVANALRRSGDRAGAIEMFALAAELDPEDVTALLEIGDTQLYQQNWVAAVAAYEQALEREPNQPWAVPSLYYGRFKLTGDPVWLQQLQECADQKPDECGIENILAQLTGSYSRDVSIQRAQQLLHYHENED